MAAKPTLLVRSMKRLLDKEHLAPFLDVIVLMLLGGLAWLAAVYWDLFDRFYVYSRSHESWELDEIVLALVIVGTMGFVYALRRLIDLKREVDRRTRAELDVAWLGHHDALTQLPNRRHLADFLMRAETAAGPTLAYAVFSLDLNGFKKVNELLGQTGGDAFLVETASRLKNIARNELIVRQGADEFLIIAKRSHVRDIAAFASRTVSAVEQPILIGGASVEVGACLGYALCPGDAVTLKETIRRAEFALFEAKKSGRRRILAYHNEMEEVLAERAALELALTRAVRNDEIIPYYQPIVDLKTGRLRGFEALARWKRENGEHIPPSIFIEMAEEMGLIGDLSEKLLRRSCLDACQWPNYLKLSFNISGLQLADRLVGLRIVKILNETGLGLDRLAVEVTEGALVRDVVTAEAVLEDLHKAGIIIALDDFGTGYSSLSQLSRFALDVIKIDRSFVSTFETNAKQDKIVRAMIALSKGLGMQITAEGIETQDQFDRLKALGCGFGQGYLMGRPMPAEQLGAYFKANGVTSPGSKSHAPMPMKRAGNAA